MDWTQWIIVGAIAQCFTAASLASLIILLIAGDVHTRQMFKDRCLFIALGCFLIAVGVWAVL